MNSFDRGVDKHNKRTDSIYTLADDDMVWRPWTHKGLAVKLPQRMSNHTAVSVGQNLYVFGDFATPCSPRQQSKSPQPSSEVIMLNGSKREGGVAQDGHYAAPALYAFDPCEGSLHLPARRRSQWMAQGSPHNGILRHGQLGRVEQTVLPLFREGDGKRLLVHCDEDGQPPIGRLLIRSIGRRSALSLV